MSKIPTSFLGRGSKLFGMASKIAIEEVSSRLRVWEDESEKLKSKLLLARDVVKTLSQLKGASMKLGQLISLDLGDYFPPEILKILEELHHQSTYLEYEKIEKILIQELGEKFSQFSEISKTPIAAASIGQVHRAKLDGKDVVIKIQYPGVAESIPSDIKILEVIAKQLNLLQRKKNTDLSAFFNEVSEVLLKEADYLNEVDMQVKYKEKFKNSPYIIPQAYPEYSTGTVLTQEFISGVPFSQWIELNPTLAKRQQMADFLMKLYLTEIFHHGMVQTDPNPGNFLITNSDQMALLDFGAVKEYSPEFIRGYRGILQSIYKGDHKKTIEESVRLDFIDGRESQEVKDIYLEMMQFLVTPFQVDHDFDFSDQSFFNKSRDLSWEMTKKCKYTPPPKDLLFLHRKLAGIFIFIKRLEVKIKLKDYWNYVEGS